MNDGLRLDVVEVVDTLSTLENPTDGVSGVIRYFGFHLM